MTKTHRQPHLLVLLAASFLLFTGSFVLDQAFRWSDPMEGIASGVYQVFFTGMAWLFFGLVPGLLLYVLYRWRSWQKFRTVAIAFPGIVASAATVVGLLVFPTTPAKRLKQFTGADLPASVHDLRAHFTGGGIVDYGDTYYFRCSPVDTGTLIQALGLMPADSYGEHFFSERPFPSWPDPSTWTGSTLYRGDRNDGVWFFYLRTDAAREQVYLLVGCI